MSAQQSYWINQTYTQTFDFLVLGNGFTGMQVALQLRLKHPKANIGIADQNYISEGASLRNAGFACFGSVGEILDDLNSSTEEEVFNLISLRYRGLQHLQHDFPNIEYTQGNALELYLNSEKEHYQQCLDQTSWVNTRMEDITGSSQTYTPQKHAYSSSFQIMAMNNELEGYLHTGKLYHRMQQKVIGAGIFWIGNFRVQDIQKTTTNFEVVSSKQEMLRAGCVISCLNAFTPSLIKSANVIPARGQIIVTKALNQTPLRELYTVTEVISTPAIWEIAFSLVVHVIWI